MNICILRIRHIRQEGRSNEEINVIFSQHINVYSGDEHFLIGISLLGCVWRYTRAEYCTIIRHNSHFTIDKRDLHYQRAAYVINNPPINCCTWAKQASMNDSPSQQYMPWLQSTWYKSKKDSSLNNTFLQKQFNQSLPVCACTNHPIISAKIILTCEQKAQMPCSPRCR